MITATSIAAHTTVQAHNLTSKCQEYVRSSRFLLLEAVERVTHAILLGGASARVAHRPQSQRRWCVVRRQRVEGVWPACAWQRAVLGICVRTTLPAQLARRQQETPIAVSTQT